MRTATKKRKPKPPLTEEQRRLAEEWWGLARSWTLSYADRLKENGAAADADDLLSAAAVALLDSVRSFDPTKGKAFKSYLYLRLQGAFKDAYRVDPSTGWGMRGKVRGENAPAVHSLSMSVDGNSRDRSAATIADLIPNDDPPPGESMAEVDAFDWLIAPLSANARHLMRRYLRDGATMRQIGAELGLAESRVSQMMTAALDQLRERFGVAKSGQAARGDVDARDRRIKELIESGLPVTVVAARLAVDTMTVRYAARRIA